MTADPVRPQETLRDRIVRALHDDLCEHSPAWCAEWNGRCLRGADAVLPIVEEETARLRRDLDIAESVAGARQINYREQYDRVLEWALRDQRRAGDAEDALSALRDKVKALADELRREAAKENETSRRQNATASGLVHAGQVVAKEDAARRLCALVEEPQGGEQ